MFKVTVWFANGAILRSPPLSKIEADEFGVSFVKPDGQILLVEMEPLKPERVKVETQRIAEEWRTRCELEKTSSRSDVSRYENLLTVCENLSNKAA